MTQMASMSLEDKRRLLSRLLAEREQNERQLLSSAEMRIWYMEQLDPGSLMFVMGAGARINGSLDVELMNRAFAALVERHDALRTGYAECDGHPVRQVAERLATELPLIDLSQREDREQALLERLHQLGRRPFDLSTPPLLRAELVRLGPREHALLATGHHIIFDLRSTQVLHQDLMIIYGALREGRPSPLPGLEMQYADYARWERKRLSSKRLERLSSYWKKTLHDLPVCELPIGRDRPKTRTNRTASLTAAAPLALSAAVDSTALRASATRYMTLLGAFLVLLHAETGSDDLVVGCDVANRPLPNTEAMIGFFVNQLPIRVSVAGCSSFEDLLARIRRACMGAFGHQELPFPEIVRVSGTPRDPSRSPLFQMKLALAHPTFPNDEVHGLRISPIVVAPTTRELDFAVVIEDVPGELKMTAEYCTDLFEARRVSAMLSRLQSILELATADPGASLGSLIRNSRPERSGRGPRRKRRDKAHEVEIRGEDSDSLRASPLGEGSSHVRAT